MNFQDRLDAEFGERVSPKEILRQLKERVKEEQYKSMQEEREKERQKKVEAWDEKLSEMEVGEWIRGKRNIMGMSSRRVAELAGVDKRIPIAIETKNLGGIKAIGVLKVLRVLDIDPVKVGGKYFYMSEQHLDGEYRDMREETYGQAILKHLRDNNLEQAEFARQIGVCRATISRASRNKTLRFRAAIHIAIELKLDPNTMYLEDERE